MCRHYGHPVGVRAFYTCAMALRIKQLREQHGWTQADLAARSHMSRSQLAMIEAETRPANTLRLNAIAAAFGVSTEELFVSPDGQTAFFDLVKRLSDEDRAVLVKMAEALAAKAGQAD